MSNHFVLVVVSMMLWSAAFVLGCECLASIVEQKVAASIFFGLIAASDGYYAARIWGMA